MDTIRENEELSCSACKCMCSLQVLGGADFAPDFCPFDGKKTAVWLSITSYEEMQKILAEGGL